MADKEASLDATDHGILRILSSDGRISMKELGSRVHLTGQAVKNRVERLEALGFIRHYTFSMNCPMYGYKIHALIQADVKFGGREEFVRLLRESGYPVIHCYKTTGTGAYTADMYFRTFEELQDFTAQLEKFAVCRVETVLEEITIN